MNIFGSSKTLSIDFGANEIKAIEGTYSKKGVVISKNFSIKVPSGLYHDGEIKEMDQLVTILKTSLSENKIPQMDVNAVINSSKIIMREVNMPQVSDEYIESILRYQLEDYIPIHPEDYVVKYIKRGVIFEDNVEKQNLLLIGMPRDIVETHLNLLKNVNLKPSVLDYQGNAISKLIKSSDNINEIYSNKDTIASIDMGYDNTNLTITEDGTIKVSRVIEGGANEITKYFNPDMEMTEDDVLDKLLSIKDINQQALDNDKENIAVERSRIVIQNIMDRVEMIFRYYKTREMGNEINLLLLSGGLSNINGIEQLFIDFFNIPCVKMKSLNKIKFNGDLPKYANAIGGLIRLGGNKK